MTGSGTKRKMPACPCCEARTLSVRGVFEICRRCGWEDDPSQAADPESRGGANAQSLNAARAAWAARTA